MLRYQFFPRSIAVTQNIAEIIQCFQRNFERINSEENNYSSNEVLEILRTDLSDTNFTVETGKKDENKIKVPVLFGLNNKIDKSFNADALSADGKIVIEVEAGRAVDNNQFLKDIFQASMMFGVEYLVIAVRNDYRGGDDFQKIYTFLETMYISNRITLPLNGILLIGY
ncbi:MAG: hypothetical protein IPO41_04030 [Acidobacteria bacterium]|nr:hypothetical protein [Acidobacteriota bacterium]